MANKLYNDTSIKAIADAIRAKNGKNDTYNVAEMAGAIENIQPSNYRRFTGSFASVSQGEATIVEDDIFSQISSLTSLLVRVTTDVANINYTAKGAVAANSLKVIGEDYAQFITRYGDGEENNRTGNPVITDENSTVVGSLLIRENKLVWLINSSNYAVRPCNYVVEVMW